MDITPDAIQKQTDGEDFYIMVMDKDASQLYYATYFGELHYDSCFFSGHDHVDGGTSRFDKKGNIYESACASCGACQHFPTYPDPGAWSNTDNSDNCNNVAFKINVFKDFAVADFNIPNIGCAPFTVNFINTSIGTNYKWNFGDKSSSTQNSPSHTYSKAGIYYISLIAIDSNSCNFSDSITKQLQILTDTVYTLPTVNLCPGNKMLIRHETYER